MRLIDADDAILQVERREKYLVGDLLISVDAMKEFIKNRPTIEPATRCENCHSCIEINETLYCQFWNRNTEHDWYCSQGW